VERMLKNTLTDDSATTQTAAPIDYRPHDPNGHWWQLRLRIGRFLRSLDRPNAAPAEVAAADYLHLSLNRVAELEDLYERRAQAFDGREQHLKERAAELEQLLHQVLQSGAALPPAMFLRASELLGLDMKGAQTPLQYTERLAPLDGRKAPMPAQERTACD
jgi:multidrug efflux pump subunit AcrA (membrane-fusion protein)